MGLVVTPFPLVVYFVFRFKLSSSSLLLLSITTSVLSNNGFVVWDSIELGPLLLPLFEVLPLENVFSLSTSCTIVTKVASAEEEAIDDSLSSANLTFLVIPTLLLFDDLWLESSPLELEEVRIE